MIRHGMTMGNLQKRYIGSTDEMLCDEGRRELCDGLEKNRYPVVDIVYASPLRRCIETAKLIYPGREVRLADEFRECCFGIFENRSYEELRDTKAYKQWLDSGGEVAFPGGEARSDFVRRCEAGMNRLFREWKKEPDKWHDRRIAFVVHGGTIMALLSAFDSRRKSFYEYQVENGGGFVCRSGLSEPFVIEVEKRIMIGGENC